MYTKKEIIYIPLMEEGTVVLRPTEGGKIKKDTYRVLNIEGYDPEDEKWKFPPGSIVKCKKEIREGKEILVAKKKIESID